MLFVLYSSFYHVRSVYVNEACPLKRNFLNKQAREKKGRTMTWFKKARAA